MKNIFYIGLILFSIKAYSQSNEMKIISDTVKYCETEKFFNSEGRNFAKRVVLAGEEYFKECCDGLQEQTLNRAAFSVKKQLDQVIQKLDRTDITCRMEKRCDGFKEAQFEYCQALTTPKSKAVQCFNSNGKPNLALCKFSKAYLEEVKKKGASKVQEERIEKKLQEMEYSN